MRSVCVVGLGYIGLPTAAMFATHGLNVVGVDINDKIISTLNNGLIHIHEPGLQKIVSEALASKYLRVATEPEPSDAFIIAVPTPFFPDKTADMRAVISATEAVIPYLQTGNIVILESTSPPRTTIDLVQPILERSGLKAGQDFHLAYSPERVLPGQILTELVENARVIGGIDRASAEVGCALYSTFVKGEIVMTDATTAEMIKLMENTYRDVNVAIANEFSRLAARFEIDVWEAIKIANRHPRVNILKPGIGVGGHCISVDPWFLVEAAPELTPLIQTARRVNDSQPTFIIDLVKRTMGEVDKKHLAVLGLAYKPDVDDLRVSPAVQVAQLLAHEGAYVTAYEPFQIEAHFDGFETSPSLRAVVEGAEGIILLVRHKQFQSLDPKELRKLTPAKVVIDTVNCWQPALWEAAGFQYYCLGKERKL
jgi:UDP-N-acetyl-D-mannosaminuronic acid dehydrogenase